MGCLNDEGQFPHWFGNIHLSGPCNRSCYFCIGQHMMALDKENNLNKTPENLGRFIGECTERKVKEVCITGTNTEPPTISKNKGTRYPPTPNLRGSYRNQDKWRSLR